MSEQKCPACATRLPRLRGNVLREAADLVVLRFQNKQPHPNLWREIEQTLRAAANRADYSAEKRERWNRGAP